jgi:hypothetical protein
MCDKSSSPINSGFISSMPIYYALSQICIFEVVQHAEVWTYVNFLVS